MPGVSNRERKESFEGELLKSFSFLLLELSEHKRSAEERRWGIKIFVLRQHTFESKVSATSWQLLMGLLSSTNSSLTAICRHKFQ